MGQVGPIGVRTRASGAHWGPVICSRITKICRWWDQDGIELDLEVVILVTRATEVDMESSADTEEEERGVEVY